MPVNLFGDQNTITQWAILNMQCQRKDLKKEGERQVLVYVNSSFCWHFFSRMLHLKRAFRVYGFAHRRGHPPPLISDINATPLHNRLGLIPFPLLLLIAPHPLRGCVDNASGDVSGAPHGTVAACCDKKERDANEDEPD
jgi:hypothetical protein